ncbi:MAG: hypothetical protein QOE17_940, partial [Gaiellales bacterium]|nr:hypothetical protein [Gaiellales bacterium]
GVGPAMQLTRGHWQGLRQPNMVA